MTLWSPRKLLPVLLPVLLLAPLAAPAQQSDPQSHDPANLMGERVSPQSPADTLPIDHGPAALQQLLLKLRTRASLMMIVAHPDDEDGGMLTYESRGQGARVAMLTLTRGEGGQNLMSADFNDALGLIRTQELLAADRYMGVDQMFGTEIDFGFSKTKEETLAHWTHDRVLYDAVRAVRLYRPLVLASVFVGGVTDGHGHHQVAGEITQEVFLAAADPKVFPEMGLPPWAPLKVYARVPFSRVTAQGMFDYATGRFAPTIFHNYVTGQDITQEPQPSVEIHEGETATVFGRPALGMDGLTFVQFARKGLALQKTQIGPNVRLAPSGTFDVGYTLMASRTGCTSTGCPIDSGQGGNATVTQPPLTSEQSFFQGIDISLPALATLAPSSPIPLAPPLSAIDNDLAEAQRRFDPANIELCAPPLRDALRKLDALIAAVREAAFSDETSSFNLLHELRIKRVQLNNALAIAHHLSLSATVTQPVPSPYLLSNLTSLDVTLTLHNESANSYLIAAGQVTVNTAGQGIGSSPLGPIEPRTSRDLPLRLPYLAGLPATRPYFSRPDSEQPFYTLDDPDLRNAPATPNPINVGARLDDQGVLIELAATLPAPQPEAAQGEEPLLQPLVVVPPIGVAVSPSNGIVPLGKTTFPIQITLSVRTAHPSGCPILADSGKGGTSEANPGKGGTAASLSPAQRASLKISLPPEWTVTPPDEGFDPRCPLDKTFPFDVSAARPPASGALLDATAVARSAARNYTQSFRPVGYPGLTYTNLYTPATYKAVAVDLQTAPNLKVAYLPGTGDNVPDFLPDLGIHPILLTVADLTAANLAQYDAVLLGVRAYAAHPALAGKGSAGLLEYARNGGVVIVQYNSAGSAGEAAPYPFSLPGDSAHNVVDEADSVTLLNPSAPLLTWPNKITDADFTHWAEEWGHGFPSTWDSHYETLLEVHDPEQDEQRGGLLLAHTGKGAYIYCALALYRQLPEGVPGAYRLLANLLSYAHNPNRATP
jgi:LmbE family N-acetylglucosaminyl deacetylase